MMNRNRIKRQRLIALKKEVRGLNKELEKYNEYTDQLRRENSDLRSMLVDLKHAKENGHSIHYVIPRVHIPREYTIMDMSPYEDHKMTELLDGQKVKLVDELIERNFVKLYKYDDRIEMIIRVAHEEV